MKKTLVLCLTALLLITMLLPGAALASETGTEPPEAEQDPVVTETTAPAEQPTEPVQNNNICGNEMTWSYSGGVLSIFGYGSMYDYITEDAPWAQYRDSVTAIVFSGGVTYIGANAFRDFDSLTSVDFGILMNSIGERAFQSCDALTEIRLPETFRRFHAQAFEGCTALKKVYCAGPMPSFNQNCLWTYGSITVYCPASSPWSATYVEELEKNFSGRLQVLLDDGTDVFDFGTGQTGQEGQPPAASEAPQTQPTQPPVTEPATEPAPETEAQEETVPATTERVVIVVGEPLPPLEPETEPTVEEPEPAGNPAAALVSRIVIGVAVMTVVLAAAMIIRRSILNKS